MTILFLKINQIFSDLYLPWPKLLKSGHLQLIFLFRFRFSWVKLYFHDESAQHEPDRHLARGRRYFRQGPRRYRQGTPWYPHQDLQALGRRHLHARQKDHQGKSLFWAQILLIFVFNIVIKLTTVNYKRPLPPRAFFHVQNS